MTKLHHLHAAPAKGGRSCDIGESRLRLEAGKDVDPVPLMARIAQLWNMNEGIPTEVLEAGRVRDFYDATQVLVDESTATTVDFGRLLDAAKKVTAAWEAITIEYTADGRRAECPCSEAKS